MLAMSVQIVIIDILHAILITCIEVPIIHKSDAFFKANPIYAKFCLKGYKMQQDSW